MADIAKYASFIPLGLMGLGMAYLVGDCFVKAFRQRRASKRAEKPGGLEVTVQGSSPSAPVPRQNPAAVNEAHYELHRPNSNLYK